MTCLEFLDKHAEGAATMLVLIVAIIVIYRPLMKELDR